MNRSRTVVAAAFAAVALAVIAFATGSFRAVAQEAPDGQDHSGHDHSGHEGHDHAAQSPARTAWNPGVVALFARLPVQEGGRIKPLSTLASFTLLSLHGPDSPFAPTASVKTPSGEKVGPTDWLMDCLFFPAEAADYDSFRVQDSAALDAIGIAHEGKKKRDLYSYMDFMPASDRLYQLARQYQLVPAKDRNSVEGQVVDLAENVHRFESLAFLLVPVQRVPSADESPTIAGVFGAGARPTLVEVLRRADELRPLLVGLARDPHAEEGSADGPILGWLQELLRGPRGLALFPPPVTAEANTAWLTVPDVVGRVLLHGEPLDVQVAAIGDLEAMVASRGDANAFRAAAEGYSDRVIGLAQSRGEYGKVPLEVTFYKWRFFVWAQWLFVIAFLCAAFSWMKPMKGLTRAAGGTVAMATLLLVIGITLRCVIRDRPPVSTLYETILFITGVGAIVAMVTEYVNRRGIALAMATVLGTLGMFLANKYESHEAVDTMPSLVAVLDTNFWLATHVTSVTIGYSAGLLAGLIAHIYVFGKVFGLKKDDPAFYKSISTMTYGMLCFGLFFSVVGTVLGGIWANESWGRFWGWDPKENGALAIVLWELIILHARNGGYLRDFGVAMASIFGGMIVASSWWGVNLLGVGLHSYGFTSGVIMILLTFYAVEAAVLVVGAIWYALRAKPVNPSPAGAVAPLPLPPRAA